MLLNLFFITYNGVLLCSLFCKFFLHEAASCVAITSCLAHNVDGSTWMKTLSSRLGDLLSRLFVSFKFLSHCLTLSLWWVDLENGLESIFYNNWRGYSYVILWGNWGSLLWKYCGKYTMQKYFFILSQVTMTSKSKSSQNELKPKLSKSLLVTLILAYLLLNSFFWLHMINSLVQKN